MIKQLVYRIRSIPLRAEVLLAVETGASGSEVLAVSWKDVNLASEAVTIKGIKGHRTFTYSVSDELVTLLTQIPRNDKVFPQKTEQE